MNIEKLKQDPLLIFSIILEYAENNLEVDPEIKKVILENKELIRQVKPNDLYEEFKRFMVTDNPAKYIREFKEVFAEFIPGLAKTFGFEQNNPWHIYDVFEHILHVIENTQPILALRIAALFHDIGKPKVYSEETRTREDGSTYMVGHFFGHAKVSQVFFEEFAKQMNIPEEEKSLISNLILYHDYTLSTKPGKIQNYIDELGIENIPLIFAIKRADNKAQNLKMSQKALDEVDRIEKIFNEYIRKQGESKKPNSPSVKRP